MRATITVKQSQGTKEKAGIFKAAETYPLWHVETSIALTEEERTIIDQKQLWNTVVFVQASSKESYDSLSHRERELLGTYATSPISFTVQHIVQGQSSSVRCYTAGMALELAHLLETKHLPYLKALVTSAAGIVQPRTIEL